MSGSDVSPATVLMRTYFIRYAGKDNPRLVSIIGIGLENSTVLCWQHAMVSDEEPEGNPLSTGIRSFKMTELEFLDYGEPEPVPVSVLVPTL